MKKKKKSFKFLWYCSNFILHDVGEIIISRMLEDIQGYSKLMCETIMDGRAQQTFIK